MNFRFIHDYFQPFHAELCKLYFADSVQSGFGAVLCDNFRPKSRNQ